MTEEVVCLTGSFGDGILSSDFVCRGGTGGGGGAERVVAVLLVVSVSRIKIQDGNMRYRF